MFSKPFQLINYDLITKSSDVPIGNGTYDTCYLASYRSITVAVKEMNARDNSSKEKKRRRREVVHEARVLQAFGDLPNIPLIFGMCPVKEPYCLVLQFLGAETTGPLTLQNAIKKKLIKRQQIIQVFLDICIVIQYVHRKG